MDWVIFIAVILAVLVVVGLLDRIWPQPPHRIPGEFGGKRYWRHPDGSFQGVDGIPPRDPEILAQLQEAWKIERKKLRKRDRANQPRLD